MSPRVFISYRRDDSSSESKETCTALTSHSDPEFVFLDERRIPAGGKWPDEIRTAHSNADTVLVVVKQWREWLGVDIDYGAKPRRIDQPEDWVRLEVALAIEQGKKVFPVLVGAQEKMLPADALPDQIRALTENQAFVLRLDRNIRQLVELVFPGATEPDDEVGLAPKVVDGIPNNIEDYLKRLASENAHLKLLGMGRSLQVELSIADAYVPLRTRLARSFEQRETERFAEGHAEFEEDVDLAAVFQRAAQLDQRGVILLGEPGSGKTTGARQLAWRLAHGQSSAEELGLPAGTTPVFLRFRNLSREVLAAKRNGLRKFLEEETHCDEAPEGCESPGPDLWNGRAGGLLWILDGLDEVVNPDARQKVSGWIRKALEKRPDDWFVVTCRFQGYFRKGVPLGPKFVEFHVRPLDDQQVEQFVRDWFTAAYNKLLGPGQTAASRSKTDSVALQDILARPAYQAGHIRELATNPLLLTILCIVFHEERKLPTGRAALYAHCVRVLLEDWRRDLYDSDLGTELEPYDAGAAQGVLARLAWWMHQQPDRTSAPLNELAAEAAKGLAEISPSSGLGRDGRAFLQRMRDESGIVAMERDGRCGFLHLSFQEFLAGVHATSENLAHELASNAPDSWWHEPALLSLRQSRAFCEAFFREMLDAGIAENHPDLAERCLTEALYFAPQPFVDALHAVRPKAKQAAKEHDRRITAILRLLRDRMEQVPELEEITRQLAESQVDETRGFAREILSRYGVQLATESEEGDVVVDEKTSIPFIGIPSGTMPAGDNQGKIVESFSLGKYAVTNAEYAKFLDQMGKSMEEPTYWDDRRFNQPEQPVVGVSWHDAQAFCKWADCRLPTEAEWEYACRAGTTTEYSFGDDEQLVEYAWFSKNSNGQTQPVGAKKPNPWGLHDMHGNVWEWCEDEIGRQERVVRGGGWNDTARDCRSAFRGWLWPGFRYDYLGFRLARSSSR